MCHFSFQTATHREMAVDVPDSFIARNKTPPRYPPPRPPTQVIYTPNGIQKQPLLSTSSATSSLKSGSSSIGKGGVSLDLQPPSINSSRVNNNHAIINTNHHNNHHMKNSFDSCNEFKKSTSKCPSSLGSVCESIGFDSMSYRTKSRGSLSTRSSSSGGELGPPEYDLGPHREMAVDVPDNFVGVTKMPPRYPKTANALQKSKESLSSTNSTSTATEKDAIIASTRTVHNNTTPQTSIRNSEVFCCAASDFFLHFLFYSFRLLWFWFIISCSILLSVFVVTLGLLGTMWTNLFIFDVYYQTSRVLRPVKNWKLFNSAIHLQVSDYSDREGIKLIGMKRAP